MVSLSVLSKVLMDSKTLEFLSSKEFLGQKFPQSNRLTLGSKFEVVCRNQTVLAVGLEVKRLDCTEKIT